MTLIYNYDDDGNFINSQVALVDEFGKEILPENATYLNPLEEKDGYKVKFNGNSWIYEEIPQPKEPTLDDLNTEMRQARANAYAIEVDPLMAEYSRKKTFNLFEEGEEDTLLTEIEAKVEEIKARYPYPVEESNNSDSVLSEAPENKGQSENDSKEVI